MDLFLAESISSRIHFDTILSTLDSIKKPMYLSFLVDDNNPNQLLDSTPLSSLICDLNHSRVGAILLNCCQPQTVSHALLNFNNLSCEFGAYANTFKKLTKQFENGDLRTLDSSIDADHYLDYVIDWIEKGASIVGGCCGVGPEYISRINDYLLTKK